MDQFAAVLTPPLNEDIATEIIGSRLKQIRREGGLTQRNAANKLNCSHTTVSFWETGRVLPGIAALQKIHLILGIDLNWLLRTDRSMPDVAERVVDAPRITRIFRRIDLISGSVRVVMIPEVRALIARAIYTADERHENAFFNLLETRGPKGFTGHAWVMNLEDGRRVELEWARQPELTFQDRIKLVRLRLGLTNHAFSTSAGVPQTTWLSWEAGREPHLTALIQTFGRLDVDLNWVIASSSPQLQTFAKDFDWEKLLQ